MKQCVLFIGLCVLTHHASANHNWLCVAEDRYHHSWQSTGYHEQIALNRAFDACKKNSHLPFSCSVSQASCTAYDSKLLRTAGFQCVAIDKLATAWVGNTYRTPAKALMAAKRYCQNQSPLPDTCYTYPILCKTVIFPIKQT